MRTHCDYEIPYKLGVFNKMIKSRKPVLFKIGIFSMVIAGLALMATPIYEEIIIKVLQKNYKLDLAPGGNTLWGVAFVGIGLIFHLTSNSLLQIFSNKNKEYSDSNHDTKLFQTSQEILTEKKFTDFFELLLSDHSCRTEDSSKLYKYAEYHLSPENCYQDEELQLAAVKMASAGNELLHWMSQNFYVFPEIQSSENTKLCMHPHWNIKRTPNATTESTKKYNESVDKLSKLSNNVISCYKSYKNLMKHKLFT